MTVAITLTHAARAALTDRLKALATGNPTRHASLVLSAARRPVEDGGDTLRLELHGEEECTAMHAELLSMADEAERARGADDPLVEEALRLVRHLEPHIPPGERAFPEPQASTFQHAAAG